jgi:hypothetical protein
MILGCLLLLLILRRYEFKTKAAAITGSSPTAIAARLEKIENRLGVHL